MASGQRGSSSPQKAQQQQEDKRHTPAAAVAAAAAAAATLGTLSPKQDLLYHETRWIVLKLLSCSPSTSSSPSCSSASRTLRSSRGNISPRSLQTGVALRLSGSLNGIEDEGCLEADGDPVEGQPWFPEAPLGVSARQRASLTLDVCSLSDGGGITSDRQLQQAMVAEADIELNRLNDELRDSNVDIEASPILTPQTEVANVLRALGDRMNEVISIHLDTVAEDVAELNGSAGVNSESPLAFEVFERGARQLMSEERQTSTGWSSVALVLAYGQRVAWNLLKQGHKSLGDVAEYTTRVLWDHAASFIVREGGWTAMSPLHSLSPYMSSDDSSLAMTDTAQMPNPSYTGHHELSIPTVAVKGTKIDQVDGYIRMRPSDVHRSSDVGGPLPDSLPAQGNSSERYTGPRADAGVA